MQQSIIITYFKVVCGFLSELTQLIALSSLDCGSQWDSHIRTLWLTATPCFGWWDGLQAIRG